MRLAKKITTLILKSDFFSRYEAGTLESNEYWVIFT